MVSLCRGQLLSSDTTGRLTGFGGLLSQRAPQTQLEPVSWPVGQSRPLKFIAVQGAGGIPSNPLPPPDFHQPQGLANKAPQLALDFCLQSVSVKAINPPFLRPKIEGCFSHPLPGSWVSLLQGNDLQPPRKAVPVLITTSPPEKGGWFANVLQHEDFQWFLLFFSLRRGIYLLSR